MSARHWVLGEFADERSLLAATATLRGELFSELDAHTPHPVEGLDEALGLGRSPSGFVALAGGAAALLGAWALRFPVPVAFQLALLGAAVTLTLALVVGFWRFPRLHHPVFESHDFVRSATTSGFWLSVNTDRADEAGNAKLRLEALGARNVAVVTEERP